MVIFNELKGLRGHKRDYLVFKDIIRAFSRYKINLNPGAQITQEEYISLSKFTFIQICQMNETKRESFVSKTPI